ncbi:MAG TPA: N-acetylmuramoyl-L-alanine amidase [Bryobacteraceae bacterium]|nr:N-acetylmuramoyl-L-alanine amidase [Bryobacteraceae bacterium]
MLHLPRQPKGQQVLRCGAFLFFVALSFGRAAERVEPHHITAVRFWSLGDVTRIAIESDGDFGVRSDKLENPDRLFFDLSGAKPTLGGKGISVIPVSDSLVRQIRVAETQHGVTRVVLDLERAAEATTSHLDNPIRLIIEVRAAGSSGVEARKSETPAPIEAEVVESKTPVYRSFTPPPAPVAVERTERRPASYEAPPLLRSQSTAPSFAASATPKLLPPSRPAPASVMAKVSAPITPSPIPPPMPLVATPAPETTPVTAKHNSTGGRSMIRVLGLKVGRIVIDPGHGGHDTGTVGPEGLREKDLVLDISKRLGALIEERMNSEVVYTRSDDTFIPLEQRTDIANQAKADLFLSIHANSSPIRSAAGVETYYLNFTTSKAALDLAARENAGSQKSIFELQDLLEKIALKDKVDESREFANRIQSALFSFSAKNDSHARDRGVRKAPFVVLIGANMPSVLAEIGFISNVHDEGVMKKAEYRQRLAESLYKGLSNYAATLSHFQVAQKR